jgi:hypothetical protein
MEELQHNELGRWPREALYALVPNMSVVDHAMEANATSPRVSLKALRELLGPVAKDGFVVIALGNQRRQVPAKWFVELVFQTRITEKTKALALERFKTKGIDLIKISGGDAGQPCTAHAGKVFSISGGSKKYPALSRLEATGALKHIACKAFYVAFIEGLSR